MGKDCCPTCEQWADKVAPEVHREVLEVAPQRYKIVIHGVREYVPVTDEVWIGRAHDLEIPLESCMISRRQTVIRFRAGGVYVEDGNSACGTFLDGHKIGRETRVGAGAVIQFAEFRATVEPL